MYRASKHGAYMLGFANKSKAIQHKMEAVLASRINANLFKNIEQSYRSQNNNQDEYHN